MKMSTHPPFVCVSVENGPLASCTILDLRKKILKCEGELHSQPYVINVHWTEKTIVRRIQNHNRLYTIK